MRTYVGVERASGMTAADIQRRDGIIKLVYSGVRDASASATAAHEI